MIFVNLCVKLLAFIKPIVYARLYHSALGTNVRIKNKTWFFQGW